MEILIPLAFLIGIVVWIWHCYTEPKRVRGLMTNYANALLLGVYEVRDSFDPFDYVKPLSIVFARFLDSDTGSDFPDPSESAMGYGHIMARTIIDDEVKDALNSGRPLDYRELVIKGVTSHFHTKHPSFGSRYDGQIRVIVRSLTPGDD